MRVLAFAAVGFWAWGCAQQPSSDSTGTRAAQITTVPTATTSSLPDAGRETWSDETFESGVDCTPDSPEPVDRALGCRLGRCRRMADPGHVCAATYSFVACRSGGRELGDIECYPSGVMSDMTNRVAFGCCRHVATDGGGR